MLPPTQTIANSICVHVANTSKDSLIVLTSANLSKSIHSKIHSQEIKMEWPLRHERLLILMQYKMPFHARSFQRWEMLKSHVHHQSFIK